MENKIGTLPRTESRILWLPSLLIAIGVTMALISFISLFPIWTHINQYYSKDLAFVLLIFYMLPIPLILLGAALFLFMLTEPRHRTATWSTWIFFYGAVLFIIGGLFTIATQFEFIFNEDWALDTDIIQYLSLTSSMFNVLGTMLCGIAVILLVRAYRNGEIDLKRA